MTSLPTRLEGAAAGSRELDAEVAALFSDYENIGGGWRRHKLTGERSQYDYFGDEPVTTSIDAAVAFAERVLGWVWNMGNDVRCWVHLWVDAPGYDGVPVRGIAATPALALCAAVVRAHAEQVQG